MEAARGHQPDLQASSRSLLYGVCQLVKVHGRQAAGGGIIGVRLVHESRAAAQAAITELLQCAPEDMLAGIAPAMGLYPLLQAVSAGTLC